MGYDSVRAHSGSDNGDRAPTQPIRRHFGSSHFLFERAFFFCVTPSCVVFHPVFMARVGDGSDVPTSPLPATSSNCGSPNVSIPGLEGTGVRPSAMEDKSTKCSYQSRSCHYSCRAYPDFENCVQTLSKTVATSSSKVTNVEQIVGRPAARVTIRLGKVLESTWTE